MTKIIQQLAKRIYLLRSLKADDWEVRAAAAERLGRFRSFREDLLRTLTEYLRTEENFSVQIALVRAILRLGGLEAVDLELLDILAEKWRQYFEEVGLAPEAEDPFLSEEEQWRNLVALFLWRNEATRPLIRRQLQKRARQENPNPIPLDQIRVGMKILYRERAVLPVFDNDWFKRNRDNLEETLRKIQAGTLKPYYQSPGGYLLMSPSSWEWLDPRDLRKRTHLGIVRAIHQGKVFVGDPKYSEGLNPADISRRAKPLMGSLSLLEILPEDAPVKP